MLAPSGGMGIDSLGTAGPSNLGKVGDAAFADADPLGVNTKISFDSVGGLDERKYYFLDKESTEEYLRCTAIKGNGFPPSPLS